ncbi:MAG: glycosyltransferase family 2 protein [Archangium sp.]|nr:glycosyltransferase family 2 protein [Archangium sp.]
MSGAKSQAAQTVGDLRTLVARRVGIGKRVALLASDEALVKSLESNQCTVLVDPAGRQAVLDFRPEVVVAFDGLLSEGARGLQGLRQLTGFAHLVLSFANAASSTALLKALTGHGVVTAHSEKDVRAWLRGEGFVVSSRDVVLTGHEHSSLSADTEAALRQLFEQLNPDAAADRLLLVARPGVQASPVEFTAGLTTAIVIGDDATALEGTVRSVCGQLQKPLELLVVSSLDQAKLDEITRQAKGRAGLTLHAYAREDGSTLARTNRALSRARGQYVCCLEGGELLDRSHLSLLVKALEGGTVAWAISPSSPPVSAPFGVADWLEAGAVQRGRYVVDRQRIGAFAFQYADGLELAEAIFFARMAAVFSPAVVGGLPTFDTPRKPKSDRAAVREALAARALRTLGTVNEQLVDAPRVSLGAEIESRLEASNPAAARVFGQGRELVARVVDAARKAREDAER